MAEASAAGRGEPLGDAGVVTGAVRRALDQAHQEIRATLGCSRASGPLSDPGRSTPAGAAPRRRSSWCRRGRCGRRCLGGSVSSRSRMDSMIVAKSRVRPPGRAGAALEQGVAGEDGARSGA